MSESPPAAADLDFRARQRLARRRRQDAAAPDLERWADRNRFYHRAVAALFARHVPRGGRVLHVGCGEGDLLAALRPADGVGLDLSPAVIDVARRRHPSLRFEALDPEAFELEGTFDVVIVHRALAELTDIQACFESIRRVCRPETRLLLCAQNALWSPLLRLASALGLRRPTGAQNWLGPEDFDNLLHLAGFDRVSRAAHTLLPVRVPGLNTLANRFLAPLWPFRHLCLNQLVVARPQMPPERADALTVTVLIPTRNEKGNIEDAVRRLPPLGAHTEVLFVDGSSTDGTPEEIGRVIAACPDRDIRFLPQGDGTGKGDAVRKGFAAARGDVLMILDADLTVPPEDLPKFLAPLLEGRGEFINGTRLVYPMEDRAMRFLNLCGNRFFSLLFTWLLGQRFRDTLCGTKVLTKRHYEVIAANRDYFGDFDPFGDFDLIFGAVRADLEVLEVPIRYQARTYGSTNIDRWRHGWLLLRMSWVAMRKLKFR